MRCEVTEGRIPEGVATGWETASPATGLAGLQAPEHGARALPDETWAVVLAGGEGTRLRGFVRQVFGSERPKQFCRIIGRRSMLRHTWDRALQVVDPGRIVTVITAGQEQYLEEEAGEGVPGTVLVQPGNRETAAGLLLPLLWIYQQNPAAYAAVLPSDHFVWMEERFTRSVRYALAAAEYWPHRLTLLGVEADGPETDYGWITPGAPLALGSSPELYAVRRFWEKPDQRTAARLFAAGSLWNTLVLAGSVQVYLALAESCVPRVLEPLRAAAPWLGTAGEAKALAAAFNRIPPMKFSEALLSQCPGSLMVLAVRYVGWSDWGNPDRVLRTLQRYNRRPAWLPVPTPNGALAAAGRASSAVYEGYGPCCRPSGASGSL